MLRSNALAFLLSLVFIIPATSLYSQCMSAPPPDDCLGTEPSPADNEIILQGNKKWYYGAPAVFNQLTVRGGYLVVCGDLTINNFVMDSGIVMIRPGARLKIGSGAGIQLRGKCSIYNYGTLEAGCNISMENSWAGPSRPNILINATATSNLKMGGQYFVINNPYSFFVNRGFALFHGLITDPGAAAGSVCLYYKSQTRMTVLYNKSKFSYTASGGGACLHVNETSQFLDTLTKSPMINVCLGVTHRSDALCSGCKPNAWGTTALMHLCNSCNDMVLLPVNNATRSTVNSSFVVSPNPFYNNFTIAWPAGKKPRLVSVTNLAGRIVFTNVISTDMGNIMIQLPASLPVGEYIVKLVGDKEVAITRVVKK